MKRPRFLPRVALSVVGAARERPFDYNPDSPAGRIFEHRGDLDYLRPTPHGTVIDIRTAKRLDGDDLVDAALQLLKMAQAVGCDSDEVGEAIWLLDKDAPIPVAPLVLHDVAQKDCARGPVHEAPCVPLPWVDQR